MSNFRRDLTWMLVGGAVLVLLLAIGIGLSR